MLQELLEMLKFLTTDQVVKSASELFRFFAEYIV